MKVGLSTASFYPEYDTEETVKLMAEMGIKTAEVFLGSYSEYTESYCKQLNDSFLEYEIKVSSVHVLSTQFEPQLFSHSQRQRDDSKKLFVDVLKGAQILGANMYVFHGPPVRINTKLNIDFPRVGRIADELSYIAKDYGIKFTWENVFWCWYAYPEFAIILMENIKSDNIFFTLDIKQAMKSNDSAFDFLDKMGSNIVNVHVCDYDNQGNLLLPGRGVFDFEKLYNKLMMVKYNGPIIIEVYRNNYKHYADITSSIEYLNKIFTE